jgi:hypothetical protein
LLFLGFGTPVTTNRENVHKVSTPDFCSPPESLDVGLLAPDKKALAFLRGLCCFCSL